MIVVVLGTDGCGKSTVVEGLEPQLAARFAEVRVLHLRPRLGRGGPSGGKAVANPHAPAPRGSFASAIKLLTEDGIISREGANYQLADDAKRTALIEKLSQYLATMA